MAANPSPLDRLTAKRGARRRDSSQVTASRLPPTAASWLSLTPAVAVDEAAAHPVCCATALPEDLAASPERPLRTPATTQLGLRLSVAESASVFSSVELIGGDCRPSRLQS